MLSWFLKIIGITLLITVLIYLKKVQIYNEKPKEPDERVFRAKGVSGTSQNALLIYHPSKHNTTGHVAEIVADELNSHGYDVTVNHPSDKLDYDLNDYDILVFGSPAYLGSASQALLDYLKSHPFYNKKVLIFVTGITPDDVREVRQINECLKKKNDIRGIKVSKNSEQTIRTFINTRCWF